MFSRKAELCIAYHIGTSFVAASLIELKRGEPALVLATLREEIPYHDKLESERFTFEMLVSLKEVDRRLIRQISFLPKSSEIRHVYYVFSSPWTAAQTEIIHVKDISPYDLKKKKAERIVKRHEKAPPAGFRTLERRVVDIKLNGKGSDIIVFTTYIPQHLFEKVVDTASKTLRPRDTKAYSMSLAAFTALRDAFPGQHDFTFIDVGDEIVDIAIIKDGALYETMSLPLGKHSIVREVRRAVPDATPGEALSLVRLYQDSRLDQAHEKKLKPLMDRAGAGWISRFFEAISALDDIPHMPKKLFITADDGFVRLFSDMFDCDRVAPEKLRSLVAFDRHVVKDPHAAIVAAFAGRVYESDSR